MAGNSAGVTPCPDGHRCENGSICLPKPGDEGSYYCDCDAAFDDGAYAGLYCEHKATEYCEYGSNAMVSRTNFCTNGGTCRAIVGPGSETVGCACPDDYVGEHCQFLKGSYPEGWPYDKSDGGNSGNGNNSNESGGAGGGGGGGNSSAAIMSAIVVLVVIGVLVAAFVVQRRSAKESMESFDAGEDRVEASPTSTNNASGADLILDPDGAVLADAVSTNTQPSNEPKTNGLDGPRVDNTAEVI